MAAIRAVCFDAYGTLCQIKEPRNPYLRLFERLGVDARLAARTVMTADGGAGQLVATLAAEAARADSTFAKDLEAEIASVELFGEVPGALAELASKGLHRWVISNLAAPYADPLRRLLSELVGGFSLSFEVGAVKPDAKIFSHACAALQLPPEQVLMVGDSSCADVEGARAFGMKAVLIARGTPSAWPDQVGSLEQLVARLSLEVQRPSDA